MGCTVYPISSVDLLLPGLQAKITLVLSLRHWEHFALDIILQRIS